MKTKSLFFACFFLLVTMSLQLMSCSSKSEKEKSNSDIKEATVTTLNMPTSESNAAVEADQKSTADKAASKGSVNEEKKSEQNSPQPVKENIPQKIVKTADLSFKVEKYDAARFNILGIIKSHQGYVSSENQTGDEYRTTNVMVVRVGSEHFDALIDDLMKQAIFVDYKKIHSDDVTEEFVDVSARLKSKQDALVQYQLILKKANTINDILDVQQYIRTLQEEIESMEGRLKYLNNKVELSTVNVTFYQQSQMLPVQNSGFGWKIKEALAWGWHGFLQFIIGFMYLWPLWFIMLISLFLIMYFVKRGRRKRMLRNQPKQ